MFPLNIHHGTHAQIERSVRRRAVALSALQDGVDKDSAAARVGITRGQLNRYLRDDWRPGA